MFHRYLFLTQPLYRQKKTQFYCTTQKKDLLKVIEIRKTIITNKNLTNKQTELFLLKQTVLLKGS